MLLNEIMRVANVTIPTSDDPNVFRLLPPVAVRDRNTGNVVHLDKVAKNTHSGHNTAYVAENGRWWDVTCFKPVT